MIIVRAEATSFHCRLIYAHLTFSANKRISMDNKQKNDQK